MRSLILALALLGVSQTVLGGPSAAQIALAKKYAPQFKFHPNEIYFSSTLSSFLNNVKMVDSAGAVVQAKPTLASLASAPNQGSGLFLATDIPNGKSSFLRGSRSGGDVVTFIVPKANGVTDLYYWLWTPFNEGKFITQNNFGEIGDHVGDWERLAVRTVNGDATSVQFHAHDNVEQTIPFAQAPKFDGGKRPFGYVAKGSHGIWPTAANNVYLEVQGIQLIDVTADGGIGFDTKNNIIPVLYPDTYSGPLSWLNYKGAWGNIGDTTCSFFPLVGECEIVTGPTGPLRPSIYDASLPASRRSLGSAVVDLEQFFKSQMDKLFSHVLGTAFSACSSKYTIYLGSELQAIAADSTYTRIAVKQECSSARSTMATVALSDASEYTIEPKACASSYVSAYTIGLCASEDERDCVWSSSPRKLRAFHEDPSIHGVQDTSAIVVDDLDLWETL